MTASERIAVRKYRRAAERRGQVLNQLFWDFGKSIKDKEGYEAMEAAEQFAKQHKEIKLVKCDDDFHSSSLIALIPHETKDGYWGTTLVYLPQNGKPIELFLYRSDLVDLIRALVGLHLRHYKKRANKDMPKWPL